MKKAFLALHSYLRQTNNASYTPNGFVDSENSDGTVHVGEWRTQIGRNEIETHCLNTIRAIRGSRPRDETVSMRNVLRDYFNTDEGSVSWQYLMLLQ